MTSLFPSLDFASQSVRRIGVRGSHTDIMSMNSTRDMVIERPVSSVAKRQILLNRVFGRDHKV